MRWKSELKKAVRGKKVLVLGVGNEMKGDDALGRYVIDRLKTKNKLFCGEMPENFIGKIKEFGPDAALIVDAVDFGGRPGEIVFADIKEFEASSLSTHSLSFALMSRMISGTDMFVVGVQPQSLEFGQSMSTKATKSAKSIVGALNGLLS